MSRSLCTSQAALLPATAAVSTALLACLSVWPSLAAPTSRKPSATRPAPPLAFHAPASQPALVAISAEPVRVSLIGPRARAQVLVSARYADGSVRDVTENAVFTPVNATIAGAEANGVLRPRKDGETLAKCVYGGKTATIRVSVKDATRPLPVSFNNEVIPIFTRLGCNQGACHGAQYGKGGFKLSLAGFDTDLDYANTVKQAKGRRIALADPASSLLLLKPLMRVPHGGGMRLERDSDAYRTLVQWLKQGAPGPNPADPTATQIAVMPAERVLQKGAGTQRLSVRATFSDGTVRDVTADTRLNTLNDGVAGCTPDGLVSPVGKGQTAIMARYNGQATIATVIVPFTKPGEQVQGMQVKGIRSTAQTAEVQRGAENPSSVHSSQSTVAMASTAIDALVARKQRQLRLTPSTLCDDRTFIRRVSFDLIGTAPTAGEIREFATDTRSDKRTRLIDALLARPEYADFWALKWSDLLRSNRQSLGVKGMWSFSNWIRGQFQQNRPMDQFVHDLITAQGSTFTNGPANFYRVASTPQDLAETTSQVFLGVRMQCAKCHHHPFEKWSQADYYQFAAFFARMGLKGSQEFGLFGNEQIVRVNDGGEVYHPKTGAKMFPTPLGVTPISLASPSGSAKTAAPDPDASGDRRRVLADWLTAPANRLFSRNLANRYWGYLFSKGLVNPIDDMRVTNPPTNPQLLDLLADELTQHGYDIKHLLRIICNTQTYQRSSEATRDNIKDELFFTHYLPRRLGAESLLDAIDFACGTQERFAPLPPGTRAIQLPDPNVGSSFLDTFGRPLRIISCECERTSEPNLSQTLSLMNGELVNRKVGQSDGRIAKMLAAHKPYDTILTEIYNGSLGRPPRRDERMQVMGALAFTPDAKPVFEDVLLTLLNSKEFLFNH